MTATGSVPERSVANLAAIDIGTNSVHLVIARATGEDADVRFDILTRDKEMVRLGSGGGDMKRLDADAIDRCVAALARCRSLVDGAGATVRAVATSAVREAENAAELVARARDEAGIDVEVISGAEEARLIHLGVLQAVAAYDQRILVCDIGGGSTELVVGEGDNRLLARSLKLGAIRLTDRFFPDGEVSEDALAECRQHVRSALVPFSRQAVPLGHEVAIGSSGTIECLAMIEAARSEGEAPRSAANLTVTCEGLGDTVAAIVEASGHEAVRDVPGVEAKRADIILAGALILEGVFDACGVTSMVVADAALREGVLLDTLQRSSGGTLDHLSDLRLRSAHHVLDAFDDDPVHARHVARLAGELFDDLAPVHGLAGADRELLVAGTLLANVGLGISHERHHRHSYYVIRNTDRLSGFTSDEIEMVALIARYHRKSTPKTRHPELATLSADQLARLRVLAGIERVAIALDRTHRQLVSGVTARADEGSVAVLVSSEPGDDIDVEMYAALERSVLLSDALGCEVSFGMLG